MYMLIRQQESTIGEHTSLNLYELSQNAVGQHQNDLTRNTEIGAIYQLLHLFL